MARLGIMFTSLLALVTLAACGSNAHTVKLPPPSSTPTSGDATTSTPTTEAPPSTTAGSSTPTSPPTTAATHPSNGSLAIVTFTGPKSPVQCNAPTTIELRWEIRGTTTSQLTIDGATFNIAKNADDGLFPLACDGKSHIYTVTGRSGTDKVSKSLVIATKRPA